MGKGTGNCSERKSFSLVESRESENQGWMGNGQWTTNDESLKSHLKQAWINQEATEGLPPIIAWQAGSHAYGLADEHSDIDIRGVWVWGLEQKLDLKKRPETLDISEPDVFASEAAKFIKTLNNANPNFIELLFAPKIMTSPLGEKILENKDLFLTKKIAKTYRDFARSQFHDLEKRYTDNDLNVRKRQKAIKHMLRTYMYGEGFLLQTRDSIVIEDKESLQWWSQQPFNKVDQHRLQLLHKLEEAESQSLLPEENDWEKINRFVVSLYR